MRIGEAQTPQESQFVEVVRSALSNSPGVETQHQCEASSTSPFSPAQSSGPSDARHSAGDASTPRPQREPASATKDQKSLFVPAKSRWFQEEEFELLHRSFPKREDEVQTASHEPPATETSRREQSGSCGTNSTPSPVAPKGTCPRFPERSAKGATPIKKSLPRTSTGLQSHAGFRGPVRRPPPPRPRTSEVEGSKTAQENTILKNAFKVRMPQRRSEDAGEALRKLVPPSAWFCQQRPQLQEPPGLATGRRQHDRNEWIRP